jgi:hypothetical protein
MRGETVVSQEGTETANRSDTKNEKLSPKISIGEDGTIKIETITISADGVDKKIAQAYIEFAEETWSVLSLDLELVDSDGDLTLLTCDKICKTYNYDGEPLGAAVIAGTRLYYGKGQRKTTPGHEIGHILGLRHGGRPGGIMTPGYPFKRSVTPHDILRIRSLYE